MKTLILAFLVIVSRQPQQDAAQPAAGIRVGARAQPDTVLVGQPLTLTLSLTGLPAGAEVIYPSFSDSDSLMSLQPPRSGARDGTSRSVHYDLVAWQPGDLTVALDDVRVVTRGRDILIDVPTASLHVASVLPAATDLDTLAWQPPRDVAGPNWSLAEKAAAIALAIALLAITAAYVRRRARPELVPRPPGRPAKERALDALARLADGGLLDAGEFKAFYAELSHAVRDFLAETDRRWGLDHTTGELLIAVHEGGVDEGRLRQLADVLATADLVKFARLTTTRDHAELILEAARRWVGEFEREPQRVAVGAGLPDSEAVGAADGMEELFAELDAPDDEDRDSSHDSGDGEDASELEERDDR